MTATTTMAVIIIMALILAVFNYLVWDFPRAVRYWVYEIVIVLLFSRLLI